MRSINPISRRTSSNCRAIGKAFGALGVGLITCILETAANCTANCEPEEFTLKSFLEGVIIIAIDIALGYILIKTL